MPQPPQKPKLTPQQMHAKLDAHEAGLKQELAKIKAVRTLHPPPVQPGQKPKTR